jgi:peptide/nickel transport system substrate-binding protein
MTSTLRKKMTTSAQHYDLPSHSTTARRRLGSFSWAACALSALLCLSNPSFANKANDTLGMAYDQAPENIDPYFNNVRIGVIIAANVWDTLVYRDPVTNEYKGQLAKSWTQIDPRTLEFDLREGIKFHNGEAFDADSVVFTLNYVSDPANLKFGSPAKNRSRQQSII